MRLTVISLSISVFESVVTKIAIGREKFSTSLDGRIPSDVDFEPFSFILLVHLKLLPLQILKTLHENCASVVCNCYWKLLGKKVIFSFFFLIWFSCLQSHPSAITIPLARIFSVLITTQALPFHNTTAKKMVQGILDSISIWREGHCKKEENSQLYWPLPAFFIYCFRSRFDQKSDCYYYYVFFLKVFGQCY